MERMKGQKIRIEVVAEYLSGGTSYLELGRRYGIGTSTESEERSLGTLCRLLGVTRQAYYQQKRRIERDAIERHLLLEEVIRIREEQRQIGVRKLYFMTREKRHEHGITMGRDGFFSMMREEGMLVRKRRSRKPRTTFSSPWMKRYPNLAKDFYPSGPNQLWVSDITYIRVRKGFAYLSLVTDAYS